MYFYLKLHAGKQKKLLEMLQKEAMLDLKSYADILESGIGKYPNAESVKRMEEEFHFTTPLEAAGA